MSFAVSALWLQVTLMLKAEKTDSLFYNSQPQVRLLINNSNQLVHFLVDFHAFMTCGIMRLMSAVTVSSQEDPNCMCDFSGDLYNRGLEIVGPSNSGQPPSRHNFVFDKVFGPASSQVQCR